ncbi:MFS transporter [Pelolinea submarina]|uniref:DHA3 family macrolide efflux protein-like MFS transporter n=1 Tax=Pelolinea submarina TaxID=913107 RepID=A0A347ZQI9_9CHLR|nr:MFS transporter [Pelolinea submarina]REG06098.1 DHA3 family macrolide efflux protein-like MFS transporter [Pelolinea submarina]BBB47570.1 MFS transporter, DHA3 family, macrolide efflux protein [Pelolinea submarina]
MISQASVLYENKWKYTFYPFWISQAFSLLGSSIVQFTLVWWLTRSTGQASVLATATSFAVLPEIIINPFAGAIVDRANRKRVMIAADALIACATLVLALLFYRGLVQVWHIYMIMFIRSAGSAFHYPAEQATISTIVPKEQLIKIAGLNQTLQGIVRIIAAPLGALILELIDIQGSLFVDILTAILAITILSFVKIPNPGQNQDRKFGFVKTVLIDSLDGLTYLFKWKGILAVVLLAMFIKVALAPAISFLPLIVSQHFSLGSAQYSFVEIAVGAGLIAGGIILSTWGGFKKQIYTSLAGIVGIGLTFLLAGFLKSTQFNLFTLLMFIAGFMVTVIDGPFISIVQACVDDAYQGRVITIMGSLLWLTTPFGLAIAGPFSDRFGVLSWYKIAGFFCIIGALVSAFVPALKNVESMKNIESGKKAGT